MEPCYWAMCSCSSLPIVILLLFWPVLYTSCNLTCIDWILATFDVTKIYTSILEITNVVM